MRTEYDNQAAAFLKKWGIKFTATRAESNACPMFCDGKHIHGDQYRVTLSRNGKRITFSFWNSLNDSREGKELDAYSVLSCCSSDLNCPETFEDFCAEYGYDQDSRKAETTFKACLKQSERLHRLFDGEEIEAELQTIN